MSMRFNCSIFVYMFSQSSTDLSQLQNQHTYCQTLWLFSKAPFIHPNSFSFNACTYVITRASSASDGASRAHAHISSRWARPV